MGATTRIPDEPVDQFTLKARIGVFSGLPMVGIIANSTDTEIAVATQSYSHQWTVHVFDPDYEEYRDVFLIMLH